MEIRQKVGRNRARWSTLGYEWFSRRTTLLASEERERERWKASCRNRSKTVTAKAISEATEAVEKASAEAQL